MRSRSELYDILVDELKIDNAKAIEILDNAFALHDDETKKKKEQEAKLKELKEKYVGKLLYIDSNVDEGLPTCIFVNDIKEINSLDYFDFIGPHIVLEENDYYFYSSKDLSLTVSMNELNKIEIVNDLGILDFLRNSLLSNFFFIRCLENVLKPVWTSLLMNVESTKI